MIVSELLRVRPRSCPSIAIAEHGHGMRARAHGRGNVMVIFDPYMDSRTIGSVVVALVQ
jgi:hypothetical protein